MELSAEQEHRLAALRTRHPATVAPVTTLVSTLDVRASESTRLATSALAFLAVSAGVLGLRGADSPDGPPMATGDLRVAQPAPSAAFTLPPLIPVTAPTIATTRTETVGEASRVDSITQAT